MEDVISLWSYQENIDEMRQKLLCTALEYEQFKAEMSEELRKKDEYVKQLIQLLKTTSYERDVARDQLQKLMPSTNKSEFLSSLPLIQVPAKANSSITESNSLSEPYNNYNSHGSSPVDSFFDPVSSPEFSNANMGFFDANVVSLEVPKIDHASMIIDNLVKGKTLPQKGKLLQAVLDAPPLLQSLLIAGPLPKWSNPPKLQPFQIPPFSISQVPDTNLSNGGSRALNSQGCVQISCGSSQMVSTNMFSFSPSGSCLGTNFNNYVSMGKKQRLQ